MIFALVSRSFGFDTAVEVATEAIHAAHTEAVGSPNGIGLVKLMGRFSGFIAATATLALREVNYVLIPEADFDLDGECGLLANLEEPPEAAAPRPHRGGRGRRGTLFHRGKPGA